VDIEDLRRSFRPKKIAILFVGESRPDNETFFYKANSQVFHYMLKAFLLGGSDIGRDQFLTRFNSLGCYLDELVPVNARIRDLSPRHVVAIGRSIREEVKEAVALSGTKATFDCVSFPGTGRQREFLDDMAAVLPILLPNNNLSALPPD
jgi:hypothetical protein